MMAMAQRGWQDEILEKIPSGVDVTLIDKMLRLTPTERLEHLRQMQLFVEEVRRARGKRLQAND
jgi:hypothetical protein